MIKRILSLLCITVTILLASCGQNEITAADNEIVLVLDFGDVEDPVYRIDITYFLNQEFMGGLALSYVSEDALDSPKAFRLAPEDFPEGSSLEGFSFSAVLCGDKNGIKELFSTAEVIGNTGESEKFTPEYGQIYHYTISGSFDKGFRMKRVVPTND